MEAEIIQKNVASPKSHKSRRNFSSSYCLIRKLLLMAIIFLSLSATNGAMAQTKTANDYRAVAERGNTFAQFNLGDCYHRGVGGVTKDYKQAAYWFRKAATQGCALAQFVLGNLYCNGEGVEEDRNTAMYWLEKAMKNEDESMDEDLLENALGILAYLHSKGYSSSRAKIK